MIEKIYEYFNICIIFNTNIYLDIFSCQILYTNIFGDVCVEIFTNLTLWSVAVFNSLSYLLCYMYF